MRVETDMRKERVKATSDLLKVFFVLTDEWALSIDEQKILLGEQTLVRLADKLERGSEIMVDDQTIARLVLLDSINKKINDLTPSVPADTFLRTSISGIKGKTPLSVIMKDPDEGLIEVNKHLMLSAKKTTKPVFG